jgi:sporulation protein YhbH
MVKSIERDNRRYREIVKGRVRKKLKKYISHSELIGRKGKDVVSIPIPYLDLPHFRFERQGRESVGQGEGEVGTIIGRGEMGNQGPGAGDMPGEHILEVELTIEELAELLGDELELPHVEPRGRENITSQKDRYTGIRQVGPESLRHFKRTYKHALKRQLASGAYDPAHPVIIPIREDKYYRSWKTRMEPESSAVIIYMMDVSGSMGSEQKEIVRSEVFWIDTWLRSQYSNIESRYIIHDAAAREVDSDTFYSTRESGGTIISSAYSLAKAVIEADYDPADWNIYPFHFSDGDNLSSDNERACLIVHEILPLVNLFCYGQVESRWGSGEFKVELEEYFAYVPEVYYEDRTSKIITSAIADRDAIYDSIKDFLGKGK